MFLSVSASAEDDDPLPVDTSNAGRIPHSQSLLSDPSRRRMVSDSFFSRIVPKVDLHSHLGGSIPEELLIRYVREKYPDTYEEIFRQCRVGEKDSRELEHCFRIFDVLHEVFDTKDKLIEATNMLLEDYARDNVYMVELRTTPRAMPDGTTKSDYVETILSCIATFNSSHSPSPSRSRRRSKVFVGGLLLSINRSKSLEIAQETLDLFRQLKSSLPSDVSRWLLGLDFSGNCFDNPFSMYLPVFESAASSSIPSTIHFGERADDDDDTSAILDFGPQRIGHACYVSESSLSRLLSLRIPLEVCLTSNVMSRSVPSLLEHHVCSKFLETDRTYPLSINTDDLSVFSTSMTGEVESMLSCLEEWGMGEGERRKFVVGVAEQSVRDSFFPEEVKENLLEAIGDCVRVHKRKWWIVDVDDENEKDDII